MGEQHRYDMTNKNAHPWKITASLLSIEMFFSPYHGSTTNKHAQSRRLMNSKPITNSHLDSNDWSWTSTRCSTWGSEATSNNCCETNSAEFHVSENLSSSFQNPSGVGTSVLRSGLYANCFLGFFGDLLFFWKRTENQIFFVLIF